MTDQLALARRMVYASACAYQIQNDGTTPNKAPGKIRRVDSGDGYFYELAESYQREVGFIEGPDVYTPAFFSDGSDDINAVLVGLTHDGYAVVAIRGTIPPSLKNHDLKQWVRDWINDGDMHPVDWTPCGVKHGKAEHGFAKSSTQLWDWIHNELSKIKDQASNGVLVTGHSKGAAMTYLIASLVRHTWPDLAGKIEVHAFAPALSVDADFVAAYEAAGLSSKTFRYQVEHDLVPFLPCWREANFWHDMTFRGLLHEVEWLALSTLVGKMTGEGYSAPGNFIYFDSDHALVSDAEVTTSAMPAVIRALKSKKFAEVGDAHSVTSSYLKCFEGDR